ncbi:hypothetical protein L6452_21583 [Arctium lappa]|uniref:Uncharacterized protein n=1 Tax=Arctium lappa TaxID=4217 RepID=A0ACB9B1T4_ARCLA|nr:hypothetical protein L6452_21583 [Arctium lappa]
MLLRITYSNTKRFLKKTIESFKSYFPGGYQRLPKKPPCNPFSCTGSRRYRQSETTTNSHTKAAATTAKRTRDQLKLKEPNLIIKKQENKKMDHGNDDDQDESSSKCLVTRKLKELEMMDRNNADLVLDIEEVLHYYSRLTCPAYRDIVEKFFVEVYSGTFHLSRGDNSVSKRRLI